MVYKVHFRVNSYGHFTTRVQLEDPMPKRAAAVFTTLNLDRTSPRSLQRQLYDALRNAILTGHLAAGSRLPSTRALAAEIGVSRTTVQSAFEQLLYEGYTAGEVGSGTYVARVLPDGLLQADAGRSSALRDVRSARPLSRRGAAVVSMPPMPPPLVMPDGRAQRAFEVGVPAFDAFPQIVWGRLMGQCWRHLHTQLLDYQDLAGFRPLREAIATYVGAARGVQCAAGQVIVVAGAQQAVDLAARVLLDPGDAAWIEDPGYLGARGVLVAAGARLTPVPVDEEGLRVDAGVERCPDARLAFVTPSHQFPLGITMSLRRRLTLLKWANDNNAWIIEDDYDSEYRYAERPLPALQGLDAAGRVIYAGTFSKVLFPGLRLGYLVVPQDLVDAFVRARMFSDIHPPALEQAVLAEFMAEGHFARHVRRMRALYAERQAALVHAASRELAGLLELAPAAAGMHLVGWLPQGVNDRVAVQRAAAQGVWTSPLSLFGIEPVRHHALLLGYTAVDAREIVAGVHRLARALRSVG